jgi:hypothetical protein
MLAMNNVIQRLQQSSAGLLGDMSPSAGGDRLRDRVGSAVSGTLNASMGDLAKGAKGGMGDLADRFSRGGDGGQNFEDLGGARENSLESSGPMSNGDDLSRASEHNEIQGPVRGEPNNGNE